MSSLLLAAPVWLGAYLVGSIPFGYLAARWRGVNIFQAGSGNIGATNIGRVLGKKYGVLIFLLDFGKGAGAVAAGLAVKKTIPPEGIWDQGWLEVGTGLAAFLGHLFPVYLGFRGGKGVATGAGVVAVLMPAATLGALLAWLTVAAVTNYISLASLAAAATLCGLHLAGSWPVATTDPRTLFCFLAVALVFVKHRGNIGRLFHGAESKIRWGDSMRKVLHVVALGLWFGSVVFFTFVLTQSLFHTMTVLGVRQERPAWFPLPRDYELIDANIQGPKEQGALVAGYALEPLFQWYFMLQGVCGVIAAWTALAWTKENPGVRIHRWRSILLVLALATVLIGWPIERQVSALREPRNQTIDAYLRDAGSKEKLDKMHGARSAFGRWHVVSLMLNFGTVILVSGGMALAGFLPAQEPRTK